MLLYFLEHFYAFRADAEVENNFLKPNPVPSKIPTPVHLDGFLREVLEESNTNFSN